MYYFYNNIKYRNFFFWKRKNKYNSDREKEMFRGSFLYFYFSIFYWYVFTWKMYYTGMLYIYVLLLDFVF